MKPECLLRGMHVLINIRGTDVSNAQDWNQNAICYQPEQFFHEKHDQSEWQNAPLMQFGQKPKSQACILLSACFCKLRFSLCAIDNRNVTL